LEGRVGISTCVSWLSTTSWRRIHSEADACTVAANGSDQEGPEQTTDRAPGERGAEGDRWVQLHGLALDSGSQQVVLDLLVDEGVDQQDERSTRSDGDERDDDRDRGGDVRAHDRDERGDGPSKKASAAAPGTPTILSTTKKKLPLTPASKSRE
jgi:hypothetical protein